MPRILSCVVVCCKHYVLSQEHSCETDDVLVSPLSLLPHVSKILVPVLDYFEALDVLEIGIGSCPVNNTLPEFKAGFTMSCPWVCSFENCLVLQLGKHSMEETVPIWTDRPDAVPGKMKIMKEIVDFLLETWLNLQSHHGNTVKIRYGIRGRIQKNIYAS